MVMLGQAIGEWITCDDALCEPCYEKRGGLQWWHADGGFEGWEEPSAIFPDSERDTPTHCADCDRLIKHDLTAEGIDELAEQALEWYRIGGRSEAIAARLDHYGSGAWSELPRLLLDKFSAAVTPQPGEPVVWEAGWTDTTGAGGSVISHSYPQARDRLVGAVARNLTRWSHDQIEHCTPADYAGALATIQRWTGTQKLCVGWHEFYIRGDREMPGDAVEQA